MVFAGQDRLDLVEGGNMIPVLRIERMVRGSDLRDGATVA